MVAPAVSIILPVRNAAATLPRAFESLRAQTFTQWELLAIEDGSTDATPALLREYAAADSRTRLLDTGGEGLVAALNLGLREASASLIARMDADDECHPTRLQAQIGLLQRDPSLSLVSSRVQYGGDSVRNRGFALYCDWLNTLLSHEAIHRARFIESPLAHPSVLFRRDAVLALGGYRDGPFPEDYDLWLRLLENGHRMAKSADTLLTWHDSPRRLTRADARYSPDAFFRCKAPHLAQAVRFAAGGRPVLVWGAGRTTRKRLSVCRAHGLAVGGWIDIDPRKQGQCIDGLTVRPPEAIPPRDNAFVLGAVGSRGAREKIRTWLEQRNYREEQDYLLCA